LTVKSIVNVLLVVLWNIQRGWSTAECDVVSIQESQRFDRIDQYTGTTKDATSVHYALDRKEKAKTYQRQLVHERVVSILQAMQSGFPVGNQDCVLLTMCESRVFIDI
jgi:hypothetical protein